MHISIRMTQLNKSKLIERSCTINNQQDATTTFQSMLNECDCKWWLASCFYLCISQKDYDYRDDDLFTVFINVCNEYMKRDSSELLCTPEFDDYNIKGELLICYVTRYQEEKNKL